MKDIITELEIEKSEYTLEKEYFWYDTKYATVPEVTGTKLKEVKSQLKAFKINYSGNGNIIKKISPNPGTILPEGSTIKILLSN